ncbi:MAG: S8 family serine peptidase [Microscillaceae bacterium]|nr:S8 family serine peptidase [Microscillaceae bacterium]
MLTRCVFFCLLTGAVLAQTQAPLPLHFDESQCVSGWVIIKWREMPSEPNAEEAFFQKSVLRVVSDSLPRPLFSGAFRQQLQNQQRHNLLEKLNRIQVLPIRAGLSTREAVNVLRLQPQLAYTEPVYRHTLQALPNDPLLTHPNQYHLDYIQAFEAWEIETGDPAVFMAITDDGCNVNHPDLSANVRFPVIVNGPEDLNNDLAGDFSDEFGDEDADVSGGGHGNVVALCAAAVPNNNNGTAGVGFHTPFLPVKVAADDNLGSIVMGYEGILYAAVQGAKVINMSWGRTGSPSFFEQDIIDIAYLDYDAVLVAAAGNSNLEEFYYPASYEHVLSVAATKIGDAKADFSTYNKKVDLSAPGQGVVVDSGNLAGANGTSFAAPLVAGAAALLRAHYPDWNAEQVMIRLQTTTDPVYQLEANAPFLYRLGTGRLNVFKALSAPQKGLAVRTHTFPQGQRGYIFAGMESDWLFTFYNAFEALDNLQIRIQTDSPFVNWVKNDISLGAIEANTEFNNQADVFRMRLADNTPANTLARFTITYTDGSFSYSEVFEMLLNPGHSDLNEVHLNVNDRGQIGLYNMNFAEMQGFAFEGLTFLTEGGLMLARNPAQISDAVRNPFNQAQSDFVASQTLRPTLEEEGTLLITEARYDDISNNADRIGLEITQKTYAWNQVGLTRGLVLEYEIQNVNTSPIDTLHAALFADWTLFGHSYDWLEWLEEAQMGVLGSALSSPFKIGTKLLTPHEGSIFYALGGGGVNFLDGLTDEEKFSLLSGGIQRTSAGSVGNDVNVAQVIGATLRHLGPGSKRTLALVLAIGEAPAEMLENVEAIAAHYRALKTGPVPEASPVAVCPGESWLIQPENGQLFRFYNAPPDQPGAQVLHTGHSLLLNNLLQSQLVYITNLDQVFESEALALAIQVDSHQAAFAMSTSELDLNQESILQLSAESLGGVSWTWEISRENGTPATGVSFVNGTNAQSAQPQVSFSETGAYQIRLQSQNQTACSAETIQSLRVVRRALPTALGPVAEADIQVYPNPWQSSISVQIPILTQSVKGILRDAMGRTVFTQTWQNQPNQPHTLALPSLKPGNYWLTLRTEAGEITRPLLHQP